MSLIPARLRDEFLAAMDAANNDYLPDGAWFSVLENTGALPARGRND